MRPIWLLSLLLCWQLGCPGEARKDAGKHPGAQLPLGSVTPLATVAAPSESQQPSARPSDPAGPSQSAAPPLPVRTAGELPGETLDFPYDAAELKDRGRAYTGRIFVHDRAAQQRTSLPLVVFFHGLNRDRIAHRWMGGGKEGDVRRIVSDLVDTGAIAPVVLAAPGSTEPAAVSGGSSFPAFDFDKFVDQVLAKLDGTVSIDPSKIIVLGHSGAGCSERGGIVSALHGRRVPLAVVSIDTCMPSSLARELGEAGPDTHVVVTWQNVSWDRSFDTFRAVFAKAREKRPAKAGVLRTLDQLPALPRAHDATVKQSLDKYLPLLVGPRPD